MVAHGKILLIRAPVGVLLPLMPSLMFPVISIWLAAVPRFRVVAPLTEPRNVTEAPGVRFRLANVSVLLAPLAVPVVEVIVLVPLARVTVPTDSVVAKPTFVAVLVPSNVRDAPLSVSALVPRRLA